MTHFIVVADSAAERARVRRAIGLSSDGGWMCRSPMGVCAVGVGGSICTLGSNGTLGGVAWGAIACGGRFITLGGDTLGRCCNFEKMARRLFIASSSSSVFGWSAISLYCRS